MSLPRTDNDCKGCTHGFEREEYEGKWWHVWEGKAYPCTRKKHVVVTCANGDGRPICPPSKVICRECMNKISATLTEMRDNLRASDEDAEMRQMVDR